MAKRSNEETPAPEAVPVQERTGDQIVYHVVAYSAEGKETIEADYDLKTAHEWLKSNDTNAEIIPGVVNVERARLVALAKLDGLDRLVLGLE